MRYYVIIMGLADGRQIHCAPSRPAGERKSFVPALGLALILSLALSGCGLRNGSSTAMAGSAAKSSAAVTSPNSSSYAQTGSGSGNGEGYGGLKVSYFAMNPANPCSGTATVSAARSIISVSATGALYLTRDNCVDLSAPQPIPSSSFTYSPYDPTLGSLNGVIFEQSNDPTALTSSYAKVVCRGLSSVFSDSSTVAYADVVIRQNSALSGTSAGMGILPTYEQDIVLGNQSTADGSYTVTNQATASVIEVPNSTYVQYIATSNASTTELQVNLNNPIMPGTIGLGQSALPSQQSFTGTFTGIIQSTYVTGLSMTCDSL